MEKYSLVNASVLLKHHLLKIFKFVIGLISWPAAFSGKKTSHQYLRTAPEPGRKSSALAVYLCYWQRRINDANRRPALLHKFEENNVLCKK